MAQHSRFARLAVKLISQNGRPMQLIETRDAGEDFNPDQSEIYHDVIGLQVQHSFGEKLLASGNHDLINSGDKVVLIAASGNVEPNDAMKLKDGSQEYEILPIDQLKPGITEILYRLRVRA